MLSVQCNTRAEFDSGSNKNFHESRKTIPKDGMIGEVHYWRDMARLLEAIVKELREPFVEVVV